MRPDLAYQVRRYRSRRAVLARSAAVVGGGAVITDDAHHHRPCVSGSRRAIRAACQSGARGAGRKRWTGEVRGIVGAGGTERGVAGRPAGFGRQRDGGPIGGCSNEIAPRNHARQPGSNAAWGIALTKIPGIWRTVDGYRACAVVLSTGQKMSRNLLYDIKRL